MLDGELPVNHAILGNLQDVFNLLPNLSTPALKPDEKHAASDPNNTSELARAMSVKTNDQLMTIYLSSLVRAITAFHDLIENKIQNRQQQEEKDAKKDELTNGEKKDEKKDGEKEGAEGKGEKKTNGLVNGETKKEPEESKGGKGKKKS